MNEIKWNERGQEEAAKQSLPYVKFDQPFIGEYVGQEEEDKTSREGKNYKATVYIFKNPQGTFKVDPNSDLKKRLSTLKIGEIARISKVGTKDVGTAPDGSTKTMFIFKLEVAERPAQSATPAPAAATTTKAFPF